MEEYYELSHDDNEKEESFELERIITRLMEPRFSHIERIRPAKKPIKMRPFDSTISCEASVNALNAVVTKIELENS